MVKLEKNILIKIITVKKMLNNDAPVLHLGRVACHFGASY
jgi:hypothetical protein